MEATRLFVRDGQECQSADLDIGDRAAGLADDHVLAEILRLQPYDGSTVAKAIVPFGLRGPSSIAGIATNNATVSTSFNTDGSVHIRPFRAIVGSRNTYNSAPANAAGAVTNNITDSNGLACWRDIRSGVYVGTSSSALQGSITLAPNSSGSARWDLIYATITVDAGQNTVTRRVKDPSSAALTAQSVPQYYLSPVTVAAVTGTPGSPAARPALPADVPGVSYNIALAYVRVPNTFGASTQVSPKDIVATTSTGSRFQRPQGGTRVCTGNNDANAAFLSGGSFYYDPTSAGSRPAPFMTPDWLGDERVIGQIDCSSATPGNWSHANGGVVDDSIDWRFRFFLTFCAIGTSSVKFATDTTAGTSQSLPQGGPWDIRAAGTSGPNVQMSNSLTGDGQIVAGAPTILNVQASMNSLLNAGSAVGLYVDPSTGKLLFYNNGTNPLVRLFFWIFATGQMPNF